MHDVGVISGCSAFADASADTGTFSAALSGKAGFDAGNVTGSRKSPVTSQLFTQHAGVDGHRKRRVNRPVPTVAGGGNHVAVRA
ncbi:MAG: hypothetical protein ACRDY1_12480 [Acidimicrobiales bacterium]